MEKIAIYFYFIFKLINISVYNFLYLVCLFSGRTRDKQSNKNVNRHETEHKQHISRLVHRRGLAQRDVLVGVTRENPQNIQGLLRSVQPERSLRDEQRRSPLVQHAERRRWSWFASRHRIVLAPSQQLLSNEQRHRSVARLVVHDLVRVDQHGEHDGLGEHGWISIEAQE